MLVIASGTDCEWRKIKLDRGRKPEARWRRGALKSLPPTNGATTRCLAQGAQIHLVEVTLADERDLLLRKRLMSIPTNLHLPADDLAALKAYARESLARSDGFKQLMHALELAKGARR